MSKQTFLKGQKVKVYSDPVSKKDFEGNAVINKINFTKKNLSYCSVTFEDGFTCDRFIENQSN